MNLDKTILYVTDSVLEPSLAETCRRKLLEVSLGMPIISVSQKPLDFGTNICMEGLGRSGISMEKQYHEGAKHIKTKWVTFAEHDCIYSKEHMSFIPPDDKYFYYNDNNYLVQTNNPYHPEWNGMYSKLKGRRVYSQLVCSTEKYLESQELKLSILLDPGWASRYPSGRMGEPGAYDLRKTLTLCRARGCSHLKDKCLEYNKFEAKDFNTKVPNLDLRHGGNYTGNRRGKYRCFELEPWGKIDEVLCRT